MVLTISISVCHSLGCILLLLLLFYVFVFFFFEKHYFMYLLISHFVTINFTFLYFSA
jgi:hypothetical protein